VYDREHEKVFMFVSSCIDEYLETDTTHYVYTQVIWG